MSLSIVRSELILGGQKSGKSRRAELLAQGWLAQSSNHRAVLIATAQPWDEEMRARIQQHQSDRAVRVPGMVTVEEPHDLAGALARHANADTLIVVDCLTLWLTHWLMPAGAEGPAESDVGAGFVSAPPAPIPAFPQGGKEPNPVAASSGDSHRPCGPTPSPAGGGLGRGPAELDVGAGFVPAPPAPIPAFPERGEEPNPIAASLGGERAAVQSGLMSNQPLAQDWPAQLALFLEAIEDAPGPVVLVGNEIGLGVIPLGREVRAFVDALGLLNQQAAHTCQRVTLMAAGLPLHLKGT